MPVRQDGAGTREGVGLHQGCRKDSAGLELAMSHWHSSDQVSRPQEGSRKDEGSQPS